MTESHFLRDTAEVAQRGDADVIGAVKARPDTAVEELRLVGGESTLEGRELVAAAAAAGLRVRWLGFESVEAQAAIAAQGPGAVRLPLAIVGGIYTLQRPRSTVLRACVSALRAGDQAPPTGAVSLGDDLMQKSLSFTRSGATGRRPH